MEPRIQFARSADGVSIAFWTLGEGRPFVAMPPLPWSHVQLEWEIPEVQRFYRHLAQRMRLVRYDNRGSGLSERNVSDYSLDAMVLDLEAVVDRLGLERFALSGFIHSGPAAIAYAARHPERVSHLLLWCAYAQGSDYSRPPLVEATRALIAKDWALYTETLAHTVVGWTEGEHAHRYAALLQECVTPEVAQVFYAAIGEFDVAAILAQVKSPTMVLHRRELAWLHIDIARGLTAGIPDARLASMDGDSAMPYIGDVKAVLSAIEGFLDEGEETAAGGMSYRNSG